jgi:AraC family transcriptional regulator, regulatory protein of adaptative response / methylated-DNA-[protein]-cysteine methyltransferase
MIEADYLRVEKAIRFLEENAREQPPLEEVARRVGMSEYHFQRVFRRWAGVSPKRFLQFLTAGHARRLLEDSWPVLDAALEVGLSGPGRLHDLMVVVDAMTPGEVRRRGEGLTIRYGSHPTPFGDCLLALTDRGVCDLGFPGAEDGDPVAALRARWPLARLEERPEATAPVAERIFARGAAPGTPPLPLLLVGTNFQIRVWEALLRIPAGEVTSYERLAAGIGAPTAARAVGSAVGRNPVAYLIPCHRVIRGTGVFGEYRWGSARKKAMLGWEAARRESAAAAAHRNPARPVSV